MIESVLLGKLIIFILTLMPLIALVIVWLFGDNEKMMDKMIWLFLIVMTVSFFSLLALT